MKKLLIFLSFVIIISIGAILYLCYFNKDSITFTLSTGEVRSGKVPTRYILEIYQGKDVNPIYRQEQESEIFIIKTVKLDSKQKYLCLFWADGGKADDNANGAYNAISLRNVTMKTDIETKEAFYAKSHHFKSSASERKISLKSAVAQVNIIATDVVGANSELVITYDAYSQFDVSKEDVLGGTTIPLTKTVLLTGTTDTLASFLTIASVKGIHMDINFSFEERIIGDIVSVPLKANFRTNITGNFLLEKGLIRKNPIIIEDTSDREINVTQKMVILPDNGKYGEKSIIIDGLLWAPINVGYTAENPYGLLFNWGKNEGFEYGTIGQSATDGYWKEHDQGPCPEGWRVPTEAEYESLLEKTPIYFLKEDHPPGYWRDEGPENPDGLAGRWLGPDCERATVTTPGNSVFFPATGYWNSFFNKFFPRDFYNDYWSSSSADKRIGVFLQLGPYCAKVFNSRMVEVENTNFDFGCSVRCVQDS